MRLINLKVDFHHILWEFAQAGFGRGKRTRERISRKGQHLVNSIEEAIQEGKSSFTDIRDNVKDTFQTLKKDAEHLVKC